MKRELVERYLNKSITIGVKHSFKEGCLFFHSGKLIECNEGGIILETGDDEQIVTDYSTIMQLRSFPSGNKDEGRFELD